MSLWDPHRAGWHDLIHVMHPKSDPQPLDPLCVFSQRFKIKSHGSMGPQGSKIGVTTSSKVSNLHYDMWAMLLEEDVRAHQSWGFADPPRVGQHL